LNPAAEARNRDDDTEGELRIWLTMGMAAALGCASGTGHDHGEDFEAVGAAREHLIDRLEARIAEAGATLPDSVDDFAVGLDLLDLETGRRLSIHEDVSMHAASTMKVPVLFELYRQTDAGERSLGDSIRIENRFRSILDSSEYSLTPEDDSDSTLYARIGGYATYRELARLMIVRSSNLATNILIGRVDPRRVRNTMIRLNAQGMRVLRGVEDIPAYRAGLNNTTTAYGFSRVLEAIARCELLTVESCEEIVAILADQEFDAGIPAGVPPGTRVANKTGWITAIDHDGGIVYPPARAPYVLVVLTRGIEDRAAATGLIAGLSRIVWEELVEGGGGP
jgi:beta-lactamase class A